MHEMHATDLMTKPVVSASSKSRDLYACHHVALHETIHGTHGTDLLTEPVFFIPGHMGDGDEGLQALTSAQQATLICVQDVYSDYLLVLHHQH